MRSAESRVTKSVLLRERFSFFRVGLPRASGQKVRADYQLDKAHCFLRVIADNDFPGKRTSFYLSVAHFEGALKHCSAFYITQTF